MTTKSVAADVQRADRWQQFQLSLQLAGVISLFTNIKAQMKAWQNFP